MKTGRSFQNAEVRGPARGGAETGGAQLGADEPLEQGRVLRRG